MRWSYDSESDSLYVYVADGVVAGQRELSDGTIVDLTADGSLVGLEVLSLRAGWTSDEVAQEFALSVRARHALNLFVHGLAGASVAAEPSQSARLGGSAAPMPALAPA